MKPMLSQAESPRDRNHEIVLTEIVDFMDKEELHERIRQELVRRGVYSDELLICGYARPTEPATEARTSTFAFTMGETATNLGYGLTDETPYEYIQQVHYRDQEGVLAVYDPQFFEPATVEEDEITHFYHLVGGHSLQDAELLVVNLAY